MQLISVILALQIGVAHKVIPTVQISDCLGSCALKLRRVATLGTDVDTAITSFPRVAASDARGRIFVINRRNSLGDGPPVVFDSLGRFRGYLGRRGRGPGELGSPFWVDAGLADSVRVYETGRLVLFDLSLGHVRTEAREDVLREPQSMVVLADGATVTIGSEPLTEAGRPFPMHLSRNAGTGSATVPEFALAKPSGPHRILASARPGSAGEFWIAQYAIHEGRGYDLVLADRRGRVRVAVQRRPREWASAATLHSRRPIATTRVMDLREVAPGVIAVLLAQPKPNWRAIPIDEKTFRGSWDWYTTRIEVVDVRAQRIIGTSEIPGVPRRILSDGRVALYVQDADDVPYIHVFAGALAPHGSR